MLSGLGKLGQFALGSPPGSCCPTALISWIQVRRASPCWFSAVLISTCFGRRGLVTSGGPVLFSGVLPNSLTFPAVFYHIRAAEAPPVLTAAFIPPQSSSRPAAASSAAASLFISPPPCFDVWIDVGLGSPPPPPPRKCMVPGARPGWRVTRRLVVPSAAGLVTQFAWFTSV